MKSVVYMRAEQFTFFHREVVMNQVASSWTRQSCLVTALERFATLFEKEPEQPKVVVSKEEATAAQSQAASSAK